MSLLSIVQSAVVRCGITNQAPTVAASSTDINILQLVQLINEEGQEQAARYTWQELCKESTFTSAGVPGGILTTGSLVAGSGYASGQTATFNVVPLTGGSGSGAQATIAISNGAVSSIAVTFPGQNYLVNDVLSASAANLGNTGSGFSITVTKVGFVGTQNQGAITTLAGADFGFVVNETMWDRATRRPIFGPKSPQEWQQLMAQLMQGPFMQYRIRGNQVIFLPNPPTAGDSIFFEWQSKYWCTASGGTSGTQSSFALDTDIAILDERLITLGAIWRYREMKGLPYQKDEQKYLDAVADAQARNASKPRLNLAGGSADIYPGVLVPSGSWPIVGQP